MKQYGRSPEKLLNCKRSVWASPCLPEREMEALGHGQEHSYSSPALSSVRATQALISADSNPNAWDTQHKSWVLPRIPEMLKDGITCKDKCSHSAGSISPLAAGVAHLEAGLRFNLDSRTPRRPQTISEAGQNPSGKSFATRHLLPSPLTEPEKKTRRDIPLLRPTEPEFTSFLVPMVTQGPFHIQFVNTN